MRNRPKIFGCEGSQLFVNSAHSVSRSWVDKVIPENDGRGAIEIERVAAECDLPVGDLIVGNVSLRLRIEGAGYTKQRANQIIDDLEFVKYWRGMPATCASSVDAAVEEHRKRAYDPNRETLDKKARPKRWTDVSGGGK